jgi:acyl-CoA synthetase (AMP-forming)/AMP-acid ligase II
MGASPDADAIKRNASEHLPAFMVPSEIHVIDEWPLNPNGKIDRKALVRMLAERTVDATG